MSLQYQEWVRTRKVKPVERPPARRTRILQREEIEIFTPVPPQIIKNNGSRKRDDPIAFLFQGEIQKLLKIRCVKEILLCKEDTLSYWLMRDGGITAKVEGGNPFFVSEEEFREKIAWGEKELQKFLNHLCQKWQEGYKFK